MKILVNFLSANGAGPKFSYEMAKGLVNNGHEVYAVVQSNIDNLKDWESLSLKKLVVLKGYRTKLEFAIGTLLFPFTASRKIREAFKGVDIDINYIPFGSPWDSLVSSHFPKAIKVSTIHDPIPHRGDKRSLNIKLKGFNDKPADKIVILSDAFREYTKKCYNKTDSDVITIPHGIFKYPVTDIELGKQLYREDFNFLFFGRIEGYKGLHILAEAYRILTQKHSNVSLTIAGSGDFTEYKEEFSSLPNVNIANKWIDNDDVQNYFTGKNIITVLPYTNASQSGVIPIAMNSESLLIISNTGGLVEQTLGGKLALVAEPNPESFAAKMEETINEFETKTEIISSAKKYADSLSWDELAKKLIDSIN